MGCVNEKVKGPNQETKTVGTGAKQPVNPYQVLPKNPSLPNNPTSQVKPQINDPKPAENIPLFPLPRVEPPKIEPIKVDHPIEVPKVVVPEFKYDPPSVISNSHPVELPKTEYNVTAPSIVPPVF